MKTIALFAALAVLAGPASAAVEPGAPAPDFTLPAHDGKPVALSKQKGKWVVLEWFNKDCPFVRKHYDSRNMQDLQKKHAGKDLVWYAVISSKPGKQGHLTAAQAKTVYAAEGMSATAILLDEKGHVGRAYGAKTTPHMFVIDPKGTLVYMGGIDDKPTADQNDVKSATNFVAAALAEARAGKKVSSASTKPYGCSVKY